MLDFIKRCLWVKILITALGALLLIFNITLKMWLIIIGLALLTVGILLLLMN